MTDRSPKSLRSEEFDVLFAVVGVLGRLARAAGVGWVDDCGEAFLEKSSNVWIGATLAPTAFCFRDDLRLFLSKDGGGWFGGTGTTAWKSLEAGLRGEKMERLTIVAALPIVRVGVYEELGLTGIERHG